jgi:hypothetical protein
MLKLADLDLVVQYGIAICSQLRRQTTKPPNLIPRQFSSYTVHVYVQPFQYMQSIIIYQINR